MCCAHAVTHCRSGGGESHGSWCSGGCGVVSLVRLGVPWSIHGCACFIALLTVLNWWQRQHRESGGEGAKALAEAVVRTCDAFNASGEPRSVKHLYDFDAPIAVRTVSRPGMLALRILTRPCDARMRAQDKIRTVAQEMYGADDVTFTDKALAKLETYTRLVCVERVPDAPLCLPIASC